MDFAFMCTLVQEEWTVLICMSCVVKCSQLKFTKEFLFTQQYNITSLLAKKLVLTLGLGLTFTPMQMFMDIMENLF